MNPRVVSRAILRFVPLLMLLCWQGSASAQIPDKFTNLKILPKSIAKDDLVSTMRGFSVGLGVRCNYCHVEMDSTKGKGMDWPSDAKKEKTVARNMMTMVTAINKSYIAKAGIQSPTQVQCVTCHHGIQEPETLTDVLKKTVVKDGVPAAQQQYRDLRTKYYGTGAYDFSSLGLRDLASWMVKDRNDLDGAITIVTMSIDQDPSNSDNYVVLGSIQIKKGDKEAAFASLKHALELDPQNHRAQDMLNSLQSGQ
ncbi:MAG: c-type cytochrome [Candidatus Eiseniibacteriota bacterium]